MKDCTGEFRSDGIGLYLWNHPWYYTHGAECNKCGRVYHTDGKLAGKPAFTWGFPRPVYIREGGRTFVTEYGDEIERGTLIRYPREGGV
jgi:hypothetical protein